MKRKKGKDTYLIRKKEIHSNINYNNKIYQKVFFILRNIYYKTKHTKKKEKNIINK
jgi:hypothetical protein